jgi:hyperosmotically inducible protein
MRNNSRLSLIPTLIVAVTLAACASTPTQQAPGEYFDDAGTSARVNTALMQDPLVKAGQVDVETYRGVVQLNGFIDSTAAKDRATTVTRSVSGVQEVHNNVVVKTSERTVGTVVDDATITAKVKTALIDNSGTSAGQINVETRQGVVQLSGFVNDTDEKHTAGSLASNIEGVHHVDNELEIKQLNP